MWYFADVKYGPSHSHVLAHPSGRSGRAGGEQLSGPAQSAPPEEGGGPGSKRGGAVPVARPAVHRGGPEGALQARPPEHARLGQEEETRPAGLCFRAA